MDANDLTLTFTSAATIVREYCNGVMAISAFVLAAIFIHYIIITARERSGWWKDLGVQAAAAVTVLLIGHFIRALTSWLNFIWLSAGWDTEHLSNVWTYFLVSTALTVLGKLLCIIAFSPSRHRWTLAAVLLVTSLGIPAFVLWVV